MQQSLNIALMRASNERDLMDAARQTHFNASTQFTNQAFFSISGPHRSLQSSRQIKRSRVVLPLRLILPEPHDTRPPIPRHTTPDPPPHDHRSPARLAPLPMWMMESAAAVLLCSIHRERLNTSSSISAPPWRSDPQ